MLEKKGETEIIYFKTKKMLNIKLNNSYGKDKTLQKMCYVDWSFIKPIIGKTYIKKIFFMFMKRKHNSK